MQWSTEGVGPRSQLDHHDLYILADRALAMLSTILYCTAPHCTAVQGTALQCTAVHCTALLCTALNCTARNCTALLCTALNCTVLNCAALLYNQCTRGSHHYCHHNQLMVALPLYTTHSTMCMFPRYKPCKPVQCTCPLSSVYVHPSGVCMSTPVQYTCPLSSVTCNAMMGW